MLSYCDVSAVNKKQFSFHGGWRATFFAVSGTINDLRSSKAAVGGEHEDNSVALMAAHYELVG